jgi:hypothetical protein
VSAPAPFPTLPDDLDRERVLAKCAYFAKVGLWPLTLEGVDPEGWLDNFTHGETRHAAYLLNAYLFFKNHLVQRIFVAACGDAARTSLGSPPSDEVPAAWRRFFDSVVVTAVRGERPAATDSGPLFARHARGLLGIPKSRVLEHREAVAHVARNGGDVLFVDDFVGTGNQFVATFQRNVDIGGGVATSFAALANTGTGRYFYAPIVATAGGRKRIESLFPRTSVHAGHVLPDRYGALHADSFVWPDDLRATARDFIFTASERAGIPDQVGSVNHWEGFGRLGLAVAFDHGTPDATLPLLWWAENGWTPVRGRQ